MALPYSILPVRVARGQYLTLVRDRHEESESFADVFEALRDHEDAEKSLRAAVRDFVESTDYDDLDSGTASDFNWGDAIVHVPDKTWAKRGWRLLHDACPSLVVHQDEYLGRRPEE